MATTFTSSRNGYFLLGAGATAQEYPIGMVKPRYSGTGVELKNAITNNILLAHTPYGQITNGDTATPFASVAAVKTWIQTNAFSAQAKRKVTAEFTRPADTTAYADKDAIADSTSAPTVLTFANIAAGYGAAGRITNAKIVTSDIAALKLFKLHLYTVAPTAINDNATNTVLYANRANYIGMIAFATLVTSGTGSSAHGEKTDVNLDFITAAASNTIYGVLEAGEAYTPLSAQTFSVTLVADSK